MEQLQDKDGILESKVKKETYVLRPRKRFQSSKRFLIVKRYSEEENEVTKRVLALFRRLGWIKEGQR